MRQQSLQRVLTTILPMRLPWPGLGPGGAGGGGGIPGEGRHGGSKLNLSNPMYFE